MKEIGKPALIWHDVRSIFMPSDLNTTEKIGLGEARPSRDDISGVKVIVFTIVMNLTQDLFPAQVRNYPNIGLIVSALIGALVVYLIPPRQTSLTKLLVIAFLASLVICILRLLVHSWLPIWNHRG
jgi:chromate transport protein ChrA